MLLPDQLEMLKYWVQEREAIRVLKESHVRKPWSDDPIFQSFKFCNVRREDDRVTKWMKASWRHERYWDDPNFVPAIILARTINWPGTLEALGFPHTWNPHLYLDIMDKLQASGNKVYTGAYMITAGPTGVRKNEWVLMNANSYFKNPPVIPKESIQKSWENIINAKYPCVGPFIAGQVIADLKQTKILAGADDWWTWAAVGPGSARGLNRLHGRPLVQSVSQTQGLKEMQHVRASAKLEHLCLQDVQNCLCEYDKYARVFYRQGKPRSSYPGA